MIYNVLQKIFQKIQCFYVNIYKFFVKHCVNISSIATMLYLHGRKNILFSKNAVQNDIFSTKITDFKKNRQVVKIKNILTNNLYISIIVKTLNVLCVYIYKSINVFFATINSNKQWFGIFLAIPFMCGIIYRYSLQNFTISSKYVIWIIVMLWPFLHFFVKSNEKIRYTTFFILSWTMGILFSEYRIYNTVTKFIPTLQYYSSAKVNGTVSKIALKKSKYIILKNTQINGHESGKLLIFTKDATNVEIGDKVSLNATISTKQYNAFLLDIPVTAQYGSILMIGKANSEIERIGKFKGYKGISNVIDKLRNFITERILSSHGNEEAKAMIVAITVGNSSHMNNKTKEYIRLSGLAHLLAISGLHLTIIAGGAFALIRKSMVYIDRISLRYNIKKIAAIFTFVVMSFYLIISSAPISAIRSFIAFTISICGVLLDRYSSPLRTISIAFFCILFLAPEELFNASFQLSFMATFAIIAGFSRQNNKKEDKMISMMAFENDILNSTDTQNIYSKSTISQNEANLTDSKIDISHKKSESYLYPDGHHSGFYKKIAKWTYYFGNILKSSLFVSIALIPLEIYHFGAISFAGMIANIVAIPLVEFFVLPVSFLGTLLTGTNVDKLLFSLASIVANLVLQFSQWIVSIPHLRFILPKIPSIALLLFVIATICLFFYSKRSIILSFFLFFAGFYQVFTKESPDFIIDHKTKTVIYRIGKTYYYFSNRNNKSFVEMVSKVLGHKINYNGNIFNHDTEFHCSDCQMNQDISINGIKYTKCKYSKMGDSVLFIIDTSRKKHTKEERFFHTEANANEFIESYVIRNGQKQILSFHNEQAICLDNDFEEYTDESEESMIKVFIRSLASFSNNFNIDQVPYQDFFKQNENGIYVFKIIKNKKSNAKGTMHVTFFPTTNVSLQNKYRYPTVVKMRITQEGVIEKIT